MNGKDELKKIGESIIRYAEENPCDMDFETMATIAHSIRVFLEHIITPILSREGAARHLGVSTRTLDRLVEQGKIAKPKRRGFQRVSYSRADLDKYKAGN